MRPWYCIERRRPQVNRVAAASTPPQVSREEPDGVQERPEAGALLGQEVQAVDAAQGQGLDSEALPQLARQVGPEGPPPDPVL